MLERELRLNQGNIPVLNVQAETIPEAWEKAVLAVFDNGIDIRTEYDRKDKSGKFIDPPSLDATLSVEVKDPFAEPRIHKNFPGGPAELEIYRQEVVDGIHDHWVDPSDPDKWTYTYHGRLTSYKPTEDLSNPNTKLLSQSRLKILVASIFKKPAKTKEELRRQLGNLESRLNEAVVPAVNQLNYVVNKSVGVPYSRRVMATTWMPTADPQTSDPPCLQYLWFRMALDEEGNPVLNLNTHWRSRDLYKAWFMNVFVITDLQRVVAKRISEAWSEKAGKTIKVKVGRYSDFSDSLHIYGCYMTPAEKYSDGKTCLEHFNEEIQKMRTSPYKTRAWRSDHPAVQMMFEEVRAILKADPDFMKSK